MFDREAAINLLEYVYGEERFRNQPWEIFIKSMSLDFVQHILPTFKELEELSSHDLGQIMHSHNSGIAHFFKMSFWIDIGSSAHVTTCPVTAKMRALSRNHNLVKTLELEGLMSRLDLSTASHRPFYSDLYPEGWGRDTTAEVLHREAVHRIVHWPVHESNTVKFQIFLPVFARLFLFIK